MIKTFYNFFYYSTFMSELFVFRCPLHISQFNVYRETYYACSTGFVCDCEPVTVYQKLWSILLVFSARKNRWFDRRLYETRYILLGLPTQPCIQPYRLYNVNLRLIIHVVYVCLVSYICHIVSFRTSMLLFFAQCQELH